MVNHVFINFLHIDFFLEFLGVVSKIHRMWVYFLLGLIVLFFSSSRGGYDYYAYLDIFERPTLYAEIGYVYLVSIVKYFDGSHHEIQLITGAIVAFTLYRFKPSGKYFIIAIVCYMIFPMPSDIVQIRSTLSTFFIINTLPYLVEKKYFHVAIFGLIGCSLHFFGILFLLVILMAYFMRHLDFGKKGAIVIAGVSIAMIAMPFVVGFLVSTGEARTLSAYQSDTGKLSSLLLWGGEMFFDIAVLRFFIRKRNKIEEGGEKNEIVILLYSVIIFSCLFLPGVFYLFEFNRLYRSIFIIKYILAAYISANLKR